MVEMSEERFMPFFAMQYSILEGTVFKFAPANLFLTTDYGTLENFPPDSISVEFKNQDGITTGLGVYTLSSKAPCAEKPKNYTYIKGISLKTRQIRIINPNK